MLYSAYVLNAMVSLEHFYEEITKTKLQFVREREGIRKT